MKRMLIALALLAFVTSIDAVVSKTTRAAAKKSRFSDEAIVGEYHNPLSATEFGTEMPLTTGSLKNRIATLKHNIKEGHQQVEQIHNNIHRWTKELAPLEVQAHHAKSVRASAKAAAAA